MSRTTQQVPNPTGKGGFGDHPENISPGGWDKTQSISYQYNKLMRLSPKELKDFKPETVAQEIALARVKSARKDDNGLADTKEITDRTEGKAPQAVDITSGGDKIQPILGGISAISSDDSNKEDS